MGAQWNGLEVRLGPGAVVVPQVKKLGVPYLTRLVRPCSRGPTWATACARVMASCPKPVKALRWSGEALQRGARLVAVLNTLHLPDGDDVLADGRAGAWIAGLLAETGEGLVEADVPNCEELRDLREGVRQLVIARDGDALDAVALDRARAVLRRTPLVLEIGDESHPPRLAATGDPGPVGRAVEVAAAAYLAVRSGNEWPRLKVCAAADCRWAFLDTSRNGMRRWCDMSDCGNRAKNRVWRERRRTPRRILPAADATPRLTGKTG